MPTGHTWPCEWLELVDRLTGYPVRKLTNYPNSKSLHFYFHDPSFTRDGRWFVFASDRSGAFELFAMRTDTGEIIQLTDSGVAAGWVSQRTGCVYYWVGPEVHSVDIDTLENRTIGVLEGASPASSPSENADGSLLAFFGKTPNGHAIYTMRKSDGDVNPVFETSGRPGHVQCSPVDPDLIMHCDSTTPDGTAKQRIWLLSTDGLRHWHPYTETPQEWLTHESWLATTGDILTTYWPHGVMRMRTDGSEVHLVAHINAQYAVASPDGRYCVVASAFPDRGIFLADMETGRMCLVHSPCTAPFDEPHAQPAPTFSPDGRSIVFGSEWEGAPNIYQVDIGPALQVPDAWWKPDFVWPRW